MFLDVNPLSSISRLDDIHSGAGVALLKLGIYGSIHAVGTADCPTFSFKCLKVVMVVLGVAFWNAPIRLWF